VRALRHDRSRVVTERTRTFSWADPHAAAAAGRELSGRAYLEAMRDGVIPPPPFASLVGLGLDEVDDGRVVFSLLADESLYNGIGLLHGGAVATILDSAIGCAILTLLPAGKAAVTLDLHVRYYKPVTLESGRMRCEGTVVHHGRTTAAGEGRLIDATGRLHASATSTCSIVTHREP
jgi:uncharacterized protein (TIGR00369 family)